MYHVELSDAAHHLQRRLAGRQGGVRREHAAAPDGQHVGPLAVVGHPAVAQHGGGDGVHEGSVDLGGHKLTTPQVPSLASLSTVKNRWICSPIGAAHSWENQRVKVKNVRFKICSIQECCTNQKAKPPPNQSSPLAKLHGVEKKLKNVPAKCAEIFNNMKEDKSTIWRTSAHKRYVSTKTLQRKLHLQT